MIIILLLTIFYNTRTEILQNLAVGKYYQGFPFEWWTYQAGGTVLSWLISDIPVELLYGKIILTGFVEDVIFWYLISCLIVWTYGKVKKKK